jgi:hypothetical protein
MGYRADIQNLRISHTSLREKLTKQPLKDRKKKKKKKKKLVRLTNYLKRLRASA